MRQIPENRLFSQLKEYVSQWAPFSTSELQWLEEVFVYREVPREIFGGEAGRGSSRTILY